MDNRKYVHFTLSVLYISGMYVLPITFLLLHSCYSNCFWSFWLWQCSLVLNNVQCDGSESHLVNCTHLVTQNCSMLETAGVLCKPACQTMDKSCMEVDQIMKEEWRFA